MSTRYEFTYEQLTDQQLTTLDFAEIEDAILEIPDVNQRVLELTNHQIKRGDVLHITDFNYRNDGMYLWDGSKLILQDHEIEEYGGVPSEFKVGEFLADYWFNSLHRGRDNAWVDIAKYRDQLLSNLTFFGTHFNTDLGRFDIRFVTHSFYVAKMMFERLVKEKDLHCFLARDAHTLLFVYGMHDELHDMYGIKRGYSGYIPAGGDINRIFLCNKDDTKPSLSMIEYPDYEGYIIEP